MRQCQQRIPQKNNGDDAADAPPAKKEKLHRKPQKGSRKKKDVKTETETVRVKTESGKGDSLVLTLNLSPASPATTTLGMLSVERGADNPDAYMGGDVSTDTGLWGNSSGPGYEDLPSRTLAAFGCQTNLTCLPLPYTASTSSIDLGARPFDIASLLGADRF